jgi:hypothetical protein
VAAQGNIPIEAAGENLKGECSSATASPKNCLLLQDKASVSEGRSTIFILFISHRDMSNSGFLANNMVISTEVERVLGGLCFGTSPAFVLIAGAAMYTALDAMTNSKRWSYPYFCRVPSVVSTATNVIIISYSARK